jgi:hypothetical protein
LSRIVDPPRLRGSRSGSPYERIVNSYLGHLLTLLLGVSAGAIAIFVIAPAQFSQHARFKTGIGLFGLALVLLVVAATSEGERVSRPRTLILHHHYVTADETAPARALPAALAGVAALVALAVLLRTRERTPPPASLRSLFTIGSLIVGARFLVEKCAAGESIAAMLGVLWLAPALGVREVLAGRATLSNVRLGWRVARAAIVMRLPVIAATLLATYYDLGTHFSLARVERFQIPLVEDRIFCGAIDEKQVLALVLFPQLIVWPVLTAIVGVVTARMVPRYQRWNAG